MNPKQLKEQYFKCKFFSIPGYATGEIVCTNEFKKLGEMIDALDEMDKPEEEVWPKPEDEYYFVNDSGQVGESIWSYHPVHIERLTFVGVYRTREEAALKLKVIKALLPAKPWIPEKGQEHYYWSMALGTHTDVWEGNNRGDRVCLAQGNVFPPTPEGKKQCESYGQTMKEWAQYLNKE